MVYNPQGVLKCNKKAAGKKNETVANNTRGNTDKDYTRTLEKFPISVIEINKENKGVHPTQKPVALYRYLIRTYTNPGDTVLDFTMGSGTTGVACMMEGRKFIGIEIDHDYYAIAEKRIYEASLQPRLFA